MHSSWKNIVDPAMELAGLGTSSNPGECLPHPFLPPAADLLRAFDMPHSSVKVLIVGQDPYPTPGHGMGLAFSTRPGIKAPRSLVNIYRELESDLGEHYGGRVVSANKTDGDLTPWVDQGVLLLNRVLSVAPHNAGAHRKLGWELVTEAAIRSLNRSPMVAILWGAQAQQCAPFLPDVPVISSAHPSPLSARRGFFGSRPFSRANELLLDQGATAVDWRL